ncbi:MAG: HD-GYP domain-containing protein [Chloroflexi bacterium]|nr:HD-GYP domain-containing protein [Chloroflexota bacterium]
MEADNITAIPDMLYVFPGYILTVPPLMDELTRLLDAEGLLVVKYNSDQTEVMVELGRACWNRWTGSSLKPDHDISNLVSTTGQVSLQDVNLSVSTPFASETLNSTPYLAHTPLNIRGYNFGALWAAHRRKLSPNELMLMNSMGNVVADLMYCLARDHQGEGSTLDTIQALLKLMTTWDLSTYQHSLRLVPWATFTARRLGCSEAEIQTIGWATLLHDIGKLGIPKTILQKPGPLTEEEWKIMKLHPQIGAKMIEQDNRLGDVKKIILTHHEKFDGSGYPAGLKGKSIPRGARILSVVDAYGSMTEPRVYNHIFSHAGAVAEIQACSGSQFDPMISEAFIEQFR